MREGFVQSCAAFVLAIAAWLVNVGPVAFAQQPREWANSVGMEFVWIPPGEFTMGSSGGSANADEWPVRGVRISRGFYMGRFEVTRDQWQAVLGSNPVVDEWPIPREACGHCPVDSVSWHHVQAFVQRLNELEGEQLNRLPTEAEWEYAARAGTAGDRYAENLDAIAHCGDEASPQPVGTRGANAFGLHDMLGNVWEWVRDWGAHYPAGEVTDPTGPDSGLYRVFRGGSYSSDPGNCRSAVRYYDDPSNFYRDVGFRVVRGGALRSSAELTEVLPKSWEYRHPWAVDSGYFFPDAGSTGPQINAASGFFVDRERRTRIFVAKGADEAGYRLRHQFGSSAWVGSSVRYFGFGVCSDPVSGFDHVTVFSDSGGTGGSRSNGAWSVDPNSGYVHEEYFDPGSGLEAVDGDGTCTWRQKRESQEIWESALADLGKARDFWDHYFGLTGSPRIGESIQLLTGEVSTEAVQEWLPVLESLEIIQIDHADYADEDTRGAWEVVKLTAYWDSSCKRTGVLLLHEKRTGIWRAIDRFGSRCGEWDDGSLSGMLVQGDRMLATFNCGIKSARACFDIIPPSPLHLNAVRVEVELRTNALTLLGQQSP